MPSHYSFLVAALLLVLTRTTAQKNHAINILNDSAEKVEIYWLKPNSGEAVRYSDVQAGSSLKINSFVNHTFMLREGSVDDVYCHNQEEDCHVNYITVSEDTTQVVVSEGLKVQYAEAVEELSEATSAIEGCKKDAAEKLALAVESSKVFDYFSTCVETRVARLLEKKNEAIALESQIRKDIADKLENFTCADNSLPTTPPKEVRTWNHNGTVREVYVLHERPASKIHVLKDFISPEECDAIQKAAKPILHRGTVADGAGGHKLSDHRKAWQAGIKIPWNKEAEGDPIARVTRRLYDYTNDATGYNLSVVGQEDLMSIQYFGNGEGDPSPDQYRPHCDGDCDGLPHKQGGRVATVVMYCDVPTKGGYTNFMQAGVIAKPEVGAAAFFSYMDPETTIKDTGFTTHSGCPVLEGTKRIAVQWMRIGVDAENPWDSFNTLTIKKNEAEDC